jgi:hypothetical protein
MASDDISATVTYMMWREVQLWNVSVLQRVHFSNLLTYCDLIQQLSVLFIDIMDRISKALGKIHGQDIHGGPCTAVPPG